MHQVLDAVFEHITHHQCNEKRHGEIPVGLLEGKRNDRGKNHAQPGRQHEKHLLKDESVAFLVCQYIQIALDVFLQLPGPVQEITVIITVTFLRQKKSPLPLVSQIPIYIGCRSRHHTGIILRKMLACIFHDAEQMHVNHTAQILLSQIVTRPQLESHTV